MLPLSLVKAAQGGAILVECKSGETYNGILTTSDTFMNLTLNNVICTSASGDKFWKLESTHIRGSAIQYLRLAEDTLVKAKEFEHQQATRGGGGVGRGRSSGRGRGGRGGQGRGGQGRGGGYIRGGGDNRAPSGGRGRGRGRSGGRSTNNE